MNPAPYDVSVWLFALVIAVFVIAGVLIVREVQRRDRKDDDE